jgi:hypothetical protein
MNKLHYPPAALLLAMCRYMYRLRNLGSFVGFSIERNRIGLKPRDMHGVVTYSELPYQICVAFPI